jgi:hypothetical protein
MALLVISWRSRSWNIAVTTTIALVCLLADATLMVRGNLPINAAIDRWSTTEQPADWEAYRNRWFTVFGYRQVVLLVGYVSLLVGAVFQGGE